MNFKLYDEAQRASCNPFTTAVETVDPRMAFFPMLVDAVVIGGGRNGHRRVDGARRASFAKTLT